LRCRKVINRWSGCMAKWHVRRKYKKEFLFFTRKPIRLIMGIKNYLLFPVLLFTYHHAIGHGIDTVEAEINVRLLGGQAMFSASLPPLAGIPGGRQPFYTYLWDFGDGHFSTEESPRHEYSSPGDYNVTLYTVNN